MFKDIFNKMFFLIKVLNLYSKTRRNFFHVIFSHRIFALKDISRLIFMKSLLESISSAAGLSQYYHTTRRRRIHIGLAGVRQRISLMFRAECCDTEDAMLVI